MPAKIFVQIASYCDAEFESTLRDLFGKANDPCNVRVGACVQSPGGMRPHLSGLSGKKIDLIVVDAADSCGTVWARGNAQSLWAGEDYVLQIDSHMRFAPHWDALLMSEISLLRNKRSILTTYPDGYEAGGGLDSSIYTVISPLKFDLERVLSLMGLPRPVPREAAPPCPGAFASACFLFGPVQAFEDVPRSALISQYVEEFILSILLWSHGWNVYHPRRAILYHQWKKSHRSLNLFLESKLSSSFSQRLLVALEQPSGQLDDVLASMLPMGCERSASQFLERTQLNFKERTIGNSAGAGWYDESSASEDLSTAVLMARPFQP